MSEFYMIPVGKLKHHPENPRLDLGDLTELTESIRANGVLQNLTVVPSETEKDTYLVVIGNRRMEAAKKAGLAEVPCVISFMNHKEQIATMLEENMQRSDLTVYEQAQGYQMMMDLGFSAKEISMKTGFSETTVGRRLKMAELDKKIFEKACAKQITIDDLDKLGKIKSVKERNALLKEFGENNFNWAVNRALQTQKAHEMRPEAMKRIREANLEKLADNERYSSKYNKMYNATLRLYDWDGKAEFVPKVKQGDKLFYTADETMIEFYVKEAKKKAEPVRKTPEEIEREKQIELAWKTADRITKTAAEMRDEFVQGLTVKPSNAMQMLRWTLIAAMSDMMDHNYSTGTNLKKALEIEGTYRWDYVDGIEKEMMKIPQSDWPGYIQVLFEGIPEKIEDYESFATGYRKALPKYQRNTRLEQCYKWLTEFGYQMSEEEIQMMAGTHPVFQEVIK